MAREKMEFDVVIVGAGPAGLSAAIRLAQLASKNDRPVSIAVLEKAAEVGAHSISGAVFETRALDELIPNWQDPSLNCPVKTPATEDKFLFLTRTKAITLPTPPQMNNHKKGNYIISLSVLVRWLGQYAEQMGVSIFPGFAATEALFDEQGKLIGVATGDVGLDKEGKPKVNFQSGIELHAKYTLLAEGCRGSLTKHLCHHFRLREKADPQTYGLGVKEIWEIDPKQHKAGKVVHTVGWPLDQRTFGGGFIYHWEKNLLSIGFVVGLDYENPYLDIYEEFQQFKTHPAIKSLLEGGRRIAYGARAISEGGLQSLPKLYFPGGLIIGDAAGFLNVPKIKGNHTAMKSGMLAAEVVFGALNRSDIGKDEIPISEIAKADQNGVESETAVVGFRSELREFQAAIQGSWIWEELYRARNIRPAFKYGLWGGMIYSAFDTYILRGKAPWTFHHSIPDQARLKSARISKKIQYPKHDNVFTFDKLTSVQFANVHHEEDQLGHLKLKDPIIPIDINFRFYDVPEQRYCPAQVYEGIYDDKGQAIRVQINASNCIHCKACDIKDPAQNIDWTPPEGGGGPNYTIL